MMKKTSIPIVLMLALIATGPTMAGDDGHRAHDGKRGAGRAMGMRGRPDPERMVERMSRRLELDETQTEELRNIVLAGKPQRTELRDRIRANRQAIFSLDANAADYGTSMQNLATEKGQLVTEMTLLMSQTRADIHSVLTPEQQQKMAEGAGHRRQRLQQHRRARSDDASL